MEGSPHKGSSDKRIIIDDLASYEEEIGVARGAKRGGGFGDFLKSVFVFFLLVGIVVGSFYVSFLIGKRVLVPVKSLSQRELAPIEDTTVVEEEDLSKFATGEVIKEELIEPAKMLPSKTITQAAPPEAIKYYKVEAGLYATKAEAEAKVAALNLKGVTSFVRKVPNSAYRVQVGAYRTKDRAQLAVDDLKKKDVLSTIIFE